MFDGAHTNEILRPVAMQAICFPRVCLHVMTCSISIRDGTLQSNLLPCIIAGLKRLHLVGSFGDIKVCFLPLHMVDWLLGSIPTLRIGISISNDSLGTRSYVPFRPATMPALRTQLITLEVYSGHHIWPMLFQLTTLTELRLRLDDSPEQSQPPNQLPPLPHLRALPNLVTLLVISTYCPRSLLEGCALPALKTLGVTGQGGNSWLPEACGLLSRLRHLNFDAVNTTRVRRSTFACTLLTRADHAAV